MAFFPINQLSKFGRELISASRFAAQLRENIDLQVARVTEMTDQQVASEYGTTLTRAQMLATLEAAQTQLDHFSITDLITKIG